MAVRGAADVAFLLVDGYDILGTVTQLNDKQQALTERTDALGDLWEEHTFVGIRTAEITQEGFYDDAAGSVHAALSSGPGNSSRVLCYGPDGTTTGAYFKGLTAVQVDYEVDFRRAELHKARATYKSNGRFDNGRVLFSQAALNGTSQHLGNTVQRVDASGAAATTSTTGGGAGYLQLVSFTSAALATGVRARIQHSSDNAVWADLITFTVATASPFAQRVETTVGIEAYTRMATSYQGGASAQATIFCGLARYAPGG